MQVRLHRDKLSSLICIGFTDRYNASTRVAPVPCLQNNVVHGILIVTQMLAHIAPRLAEG